MIQYWTWIGLRSIVQWKFNGLRNGFLLNINRAESKLQGLTFKSDQCRSLTGDQLCALQKQDGIWCVVQVYDVDSQHQTTAEILPPEVKKLIENNAELFSEASGLPPSRAYEHTIPLLNGVEPFRLRPY